MILFRRARATALLMGMCMTIGTLGTPSAGATNVLIDPGFEAQAVSPTNNGVGGWSSLPGAAFSTDVARSGTRSMKIVTANNHSGSFQTFPAFFGDQYRLTGWALTPTTLQGNPAFGVLQVTYFSGLDGTGTNLGTGETPGTAKSSNPINASTASNTWTFLDLGVASAPPGTRSVQASILFTDLNGPVNGEGVYFDDLDLQLVGIPEPSTLTAMGIGFIAIVGRRRKCVG